MKSIFKFTSTIVLLIVSAVGCQQLKNLENRAVQKPNILFIMVDDLGWTDISTGAPNMGNGSIYYESPNVDRLAEKGMSFTNAYSSGPNCAPTRAALMSGQYGTRTKMYTVGNPNRGNSTQRKLDAADNKEYLDLGQITLAETLQKAGYITGHFGKWHLGGGLGGGLPDEQGFDTNIGGTNGGGSSGGFFSNNEGAYPAKVNAPIMPGLEANGIANQWLDDRLTNEAIKFMEQKKRQPFFVYMSFFAVHTPISSPEDDKAYFDGKEKNKYHNNQTYAGFIKSFDDNIGRLINYLETTPDPNDVTKKMVDNTLVLFYSDNGGLGGYERSGIRGWEFTSQHPLRDGKGSMKEGGICVPLIVYWKNKIKPNSINHTPVTTVDFYPTLTMLTRGQKPDNTILDGIDLIPVLMEENFKTNRALYWHFPAYLEAYQSNDNPNFRTTPASVIRKGDWKLLFYYETRHWELYNLATDIGENHNVASTNEKIVKRLGEQLVKWLKDTNADMPREKNSGKEVSLPIF